MTPEDGRNDPLEALLGPTGDEVSCERCFELLDAYVELELDGDDPDAKLPGVREHLEGCPACREDHESLRDLVRSRDPGAG
jgi:hypothetical protein